MTEETKRDLLLALEKPFYSIYEAADVIGVHHKTIRNHINNGTLRAGKVGRQWKIAKADLLKYINEAGDTNGTHKDINLTKEELRILRDLTTKEITNTWNKNGTKAAEKRLLKLRRINNKLGKALTI